MCWNLLNEVLKPKATPYMGLFQQHKITKYLIDILLNTLNIIEYTFNSIHKFNVYVHSIHIRSIQSPFNANSVQFQCPFKSNIFTIFYCIIGLQINHCSNKRNLKFFLSTLTISSSLKVGSLSPNPQRLFKRATTFGGLSSSVSQFIH
jgi:hypothetical protein